MVQKFVGERKYKPERYNSDLDEKALEEIRDLGRLPVRDELNDEEREKFRGLGQSKVWDQMMFFLKRYWRDDDVDVRLCFLFANYFHYKCKLLGNDFNEFEVNTAFAFFQKLDDPRPVKAIKDELAKYDVDNNGRMSFVEFCIMWFKKDRLVELFEDIDGPSDLIEYRDATQDQIRGFEKTLENLRVEKENLDAKRGDDGQRGVNAFKDGQRAKEIAEQEIPKYEEELVRAKKRLQIVSIKLDNEGSACLKNLKEGGMVRYSVFAQRELHATYSYLEQDWELNKGAE
jgi:hypothetical protein